MDPEERIADSMEKVVQLLALVCLTILTSQKPRGYDQDVPDLPPGEEIVERVNQISPPP